MTADDIDGLVAQAAERNASLDITGVLVTTGSLFFQVIEGPAANVDMLYGDISGDARHKELLLLSVEAAARERLFPEWPMRKISLDKTSDARLEPLRAILEAVIESRQRIEELTGVLETSIWQVVNDSP